MITGTTRSRRPAPPRHTGWAALTVLICLLAAPEVTRSQEIPLVGTLLTEGGTPLEGATVSLGPKVEDHERWWAFLDDLSAPKPLDETVTGADGSFRLQAPGPGFWTVVAEAPGRWPMEHALEPLLAPPPDAPLTPHVVPPVELLPTVPMRIRVTLADAGSEAPSSSPADRTAGWRSRPA